MAGKTAAPWELIYTEATDEPKTYPTTAKEAAERIAKLLGEHVITTKKYAAGATLKSGELAVQEKTGETFTLPAVATADQLIGIFSTVAETKVTGAAETIGPGLKAAAWKLTTGQGALLQSDGVNWLLIAGEYKRESTYTAKTFTKAEAEAGVTPSTSRPAEVIVFLSSSGSIEAEGVSITAGSGSSPWTIKLNPGQKWKANQEAATRTIIL